MKTLLLLHQVLFHEPEEVPLLINKGIVVGPGTFTAVAMRREKVCCILEQYDFEMLGYCLVCERQMYERTDICSFSLSYICECGRSEKRKDA